MNGLFVFLDRVEYNRFCTKINLIYITLILHEIKLKYITLILPEINLKMISLIWDIKESIDSLIGGSTNSYKIYLLSGFKYSSLPLSFFHYTSY